MRGKKFYNRNEKETLAKLGFKPTAASGAGWLEKEDGESDVAVSQLKSTDAESYKMTLLDLQKLEYNAGLRRKIGIFITQFLKTGEIYLTVYLRDWENLKRISMGQEIIPNEVLVKQDEIVETINKSVVKSSSQGRKQFYEKRDEEWRKRKGPR